MKENDFQTGNHFLSCKLTLFFAPPTNDKDSPSMQAAESRLQLRIRRRELSGAYTCLGLPSASTQHPNAGDIQAQTIAWALDMGLADQKLAQHLDAQKISHLMTRTFRNAHNLRVLQLASDWTTLFCVLDDRIEKISGSEEVATYLRDLLLVLRDGKTQGKNDPIQKACLNLHRRFHAEEHGPWLGRFFRSVEASFNAFMKEAVSRTTRIPMDLETYCRDRTETVGIKTGLNIGELLYGICLPTTVLNRNLILSLANSASLTVGLANDILTFDKEFEAGEVSNVVMVLMAEKGLTPEQALSQATVMHNDEIVRYQCLSRQARLEGSANDQNYLRVLDGFMESHMWWAYETGRYG